jgi:uncharacterized protein YdaU (DUF1376 family)
MPKPYMQFYTNDWRGATAHLSTWQKGAYIELLCQQWNKERPLCYKECLSIARAFTQEEIESLKEVLSEYFVYSEENDNYENKRVSKELEAYYKKAETLSERAKKASSKRWGSNKEECLLHSSSIPQASVKHSSSIPQALLEECHSESESESDIKKENTLTNVNVKKKNLVSKNRNSKNSEKHKPDKKTFGEFGRVALTDEQHVKLKELWGVRLDEGISVLDTYLENTPNKRIGSKAYFNHYAVLGKASWVFQKVHDPKTQNAGQVYPPRHGPAAYNNNQWDNTVSGITEF